MQLEKSVEYKKAKLKFIVTSTASLLLVFIIVSCAFLNSSDPTTGETKTNDKANINYIEANKILQHRLQDLDNSFALSGQKKSNADGQLKAQRALQGSLDSLQKELKQKNRLEQNEEFNSLFLFFRNALQTRSQLADNYANLQAGTGKSIPVKNEQKPGEDVNPELAKLKAALQQKQAQIESLQQDLRQSADKDKQIAALRMQLQQAGKRPGEEKDNGETAWKQKFTTLQARFKELDAEYNALSQSYQNAVANNRKLLNQLQTGKKS